MPTSYNILHLDINGVSVEKIKLKPDSDVKEIGEGLKKAWGLNDNIQDEWEIYFFMESSMNKK